MEYGPRLWSVHQEVVDDGAAPGRVLRWDRGVLTVPIRHRITGVARAPEVQRALRFGVVGLGGVGVNLAVLAALVAYADLTPLVAGVLATECAILFNFSLHERWTFADGRHGSTLLRLGRYNTVALVSLAVTAGVLALLTVVFDVHHLPAQLAGIAAATCWNYGLSRFWTWRPRHPRDEALTVAAAGD